MNGRLLSVSQRTWTQFGSPCTQIYSELLCEKARRAIIPECDSAKSALADWCLLTRARRSTTANTQLQQNKQVKRVWVGGFLHYLCTSKQLFAMHERLPHTQQQQANQSWSSINPWLQLGQEELNTASPYKSLTTWTGSARAWRSCACAPRPGRPRCAACAWQRSSTRAQSPGPRLQRRRAGWRGRLRRRPCWAPRS